MLADPAILVVGAGVSGLACAQALAAGGAAVAVLERARGVGGRCATRRLEGQPMDLGPVFLHGRSAGFRRALAATPAAALPDWPGSVQGAGRPCQPEAFAPGERRTAFAEGLNAFPKALATGLAVRTGTEATALAPSGAGLALHTADGAPQSARTVVLALAPEQTLRLLDASPALAAAAPAELASLRALLGLAHSEPSLALAALYPRSTEAPPWDLLYPEDSRILQLVAHDSRKRREPAFLGLVLQAHARWAGAHLDDPDWPRLLLAEAARLLGPWAAAPLHRHPHRWRYARTGRSGEMAAPLLFHLPGGARLGVCGDRFAAGGGVEAAWLSGGALARRIQMEDA